MSACLDKQPQAQSMHLDAEVEIHHWKTHHEKEALKTEKPVQCFFL